MQLPSSPRRAPALSALLVLLVVGISPSLQAATPLNLEQHRGKVVLVDFWASWCTPCRQSFPWLNELQAKYGEQGLVVIGVNVDRTHEDAARFLRDVPAKFSIVYDPEGALASRYEVPGMPSSFVFGPSGELIAKHIGFRSADRDKRESEIRSLLPTSKQSP